MEPFVEVEGKEIRTPGQREEERDEY